ncbi:MAG: beta-ketoacyl-[acyl-carrier-protein] synthase II [Clostridiales bacterium]|nr:MAG: beta-ketoacyl-[acyl-carrier-protein] synthase II [Clostridiales bacterium]
MRRVAVTGLGAITPVGNDINSLRESLFAGRHGIGPITKFDTEGFKATLAAEVKGFDASEYYTDKSEMRRTDLFAQYAMGAAAQAVDDSGISGHIENERLGVYVGSGIGGMNTFVSETLKLKERGPGRVSPFFIPMMISNMAAGTIAIRFGAKGPTLPAVTACATSTNTIGEAYRAIAYGYADAIIAGGAEATVTPLAVAGFTNCMALCEGSDPDSASIPFDARRSGFVMGEGAGILVLEEYEHAEKRGAKIYAEITGYGNTCDAYHITAPHPEAEGAARAISLAAAQAGITGGDGLYINAHGTGTPMNDKAETLAVKKALGDAEARKALISSTKSMTGHMLGAAGAVEAIACVLALCEGMVPPTVGYREPDPECDLNYVPNKAVRADISCALSSSLGFGGHNAVIAFRKV